LIIVAIKTQQSIPLEWSLTHMQLSTI